MMFCRRAQAGKPTIRSMPLIRMDEVVKVEKLSGP
jgi:hypothetical protein